MEGGTIHFVAFAICISKMAGRFFSLFRNYSKELTKEQKSKRNIYRCNLGCQGKMSSVKAVKDHWISTKKHCDKCPEVSSPNSRKKVKKCVCAYPCNYCGNCTLEKRKCLSFDPCPRGFKIPKSDWDNVLLRRFEEKNKEHHQTYEDKITWIKYLSEEQKVKYKELIKAHEEGKDEGNTDGEEAQDES